jgi:phospholipase D
VNRILRLAPGALLLLAAGFVAGARETMAEAAPTPVLIELHFAPGPECRDAAVRLVDGAKTSVRLSAYTLSSKPIEAALKRAHGRGVDVRILVDRTNRAHSAVEMRQAGIETHVDATHPVNHAKYVEVDGIKTLFGSANWTPSSERDHEACAVVTDVNVAAKFDADSELQ